MQRKTQHVADPNRGMGLVDHAAVNPQMAA